MQRVLYFGLLLLLGACSASSAKQEAPNRWADERLWPVLEAQEHRRIEVLCALLADSSSFVREAAALAFASVQDSASIPCLLKALGDTETAVRSTAAFALGFIADSATVAHMADAAVNERDSTVQRAYMNASFIAIARQGRMKDPNAVLHYLESAQGQERVRAADVLRRLPDSLVQKAENEINDLMAQEGTEVRQFLILAMKKFAVWVSQRSMQIMAVEQTSPGERVNALRVCGAIEGMSEDEFFFIQVGDPVTGQVALDVLRGRPTLDAQRCFYYEEQLSDTASRIALLALAKQHGDHSESFEASMRLEAIAMTVRSPYLKAAVLEARTSGETLGSQEEMLAIMRSDSSAIERQAAFRNAIRNTREVMMHARYASREAQYAGLSEVVSTAINTGDAGLISAAAELLNEEDPEVIQLLLPPTLEKQALLPLQPIRDLEARLLLANVVAKRDGLSPPAHQRPAFNHAIDPVKLSALKQGQQYRIVTNKGEIVIATDVDECPGSSLAFDSLVTAGYYNGKYFHRAVPNFVVQGGCPRGDGYGGMPWTLRTEIGRSPFTAGSVGLASAGPDTESCQFFITHSAAPHLDGRYTRFGQVVSGMDVIWELQVGDLMLRVERMP